MKYNKDYYLTSREASVISRSACKHLQELNNKILKERKYVDDDKFEEQLSDLLTLKIAVGKILRIIVDKD